MATQDKLTQRELELKAELAKIDLHRQSIATSNKFFADTDPATRRVLIARDAIRQINTGRISPAGYDGGNSCYLTFGSTANAKIASSAVCDIRSEANGLKCTACIRGSILLGCISKFNNLTNVDLGDVGTNGFNLNAEALKRYEERFFDPKQLALMEAAYERRSVGRANTLSDTERSRAYAFSNRIPDRTERLLAILTNVVLNKGTFVP